MTKHIYKNEKIQSGIYIFTNKINGKKYIGKSKNLRSRITGYTTIGKRNKGKGVDSVFVRALRKYRWNNFHLQLFSLEECKLDAYEKALIFLFDTTDLNKGYNQTDGGTETKYTEYARKKISENRLAKTFEQRLEKTIIKQLKQLINEAKTEQRRRRKEFFNSPEQKQLRYEAGRQKIKDKLPETVIKIKSKITGKKKKGYKKRINQKHVCPHCGLEGIGNAMLRHHFDKCRFKHLSGILTF